MSDPITAAVQHSLDLHALRPLVDEALAAWADVKEYNTDIDRERLDRAMERLGKGVGG